MFKYWDKVRVTSWFYEWIEGIVINKFLWFYQIRYAYWQQEPYGSAVTKREFLTTFLISEKKLNYNL